MNLGTNPNWPSGGLGPVVFTMTDEFGFQLTGTAQVTRIGGVAVGAFPINEVVFLVQQLRLDLFGISNSGSSGIGEATNTATLSISSGGSPIAANSIFIYN